MVTSRTETRQFRRSGETFSVAETSVKMDISLTVSRPFRRRREYAFSGSETSKNCYFANEDPAFSARMRKIFSCPEKSEKMVISGTVSRPFRRRRENAFSSSETSKNGHFTNGYQSAGIHSHFTYRELCGRGIFIICFVILRW